MKKIDQIIMISKMRLEKGIHSIEFPSNNSYKQIEKTDNL